MPQGRILVPLLFLLFIDDLPITLCCFIYWFICGGKVVLQSNLNWTMSHVDKWWLYNWYSSNVKINQELCLLQHNNTDIFCKMIVLYKNVVLGQSSCEQIIRCSFPEWFKMEFACQSHLQTGIIIWCRKMTPRGQILL